MCLTKRTHLSLVALSNLLQKMQLTKRSVHITLRPGSAACSESSHLTRHPEAPSDRGFLRCSEVGGGFLCSYSSDTWRLCKSSALPGSPLRWLHAGAMQRQLMKQRSLQSAAGNPLFFTFCFAGLSNWAETCWSKASQRVSYLRPSPDPLPFLITG